MEVLVKVFNDLKQFKWLCNRQKILNFNGYQWYEFQNFEAHFPELFSLAERLFS